MFKIINEEKKQKEKLKPTIKYTKNSVIPYITFCCSLHSLFLPVIMSGLNADDWSLL